ncbi:hypothetical protein FHS91_000551 [Sphingobium xanthum]|uniref:DUF4145 domain-containing protein n=1 Tax=Sphingobium xanthum TaxID=1387165 RepID=UPI001C8B88E2|nr:DUF4145 domain-containing protein [Sphingobium xanthum]
MTTHFKNDCPHCRTRGAGFVVVYQWPFRNHSSFANFLAICGVCNNGVVVLSNSIAPNHPSLLQGMNNYPGTICTIVKMWPDYSPEAPAGVPENVTGFYLQGLENLHHQRWDAAGAMFRKTLDTATKTIAPDLKSISLFARINKLVEQGLLTPAMGDWSHEIRLDGNDAVHDEEPETESDAKKSQKFTEAFLNYTFTLPAMVADSRADRQQ